MPRETRTYGKASDGRVGRCYKAVQDMALYLSNNYLTDEWDRLAPILYGAALECRTCRQFQMAVYLLPVDGYPIVAFYKLCRIDRQRVAVATTTTTAAQ